MYSIRILVSMLRETVTFPVKGSTLTVSTLILGILAAPVLNPEIAPKAKICLV